MPLKEFNRRVSITVMYYGCLIESSFNLNYMDSVGKIIKRDMIESNLNRQIPISMRTDTDIYGVCFSRSNISITFRRPSKGTPIYYFVVYQRGKRKRYVSRRYSKDEAVRRANMEKMRKNSVMIMARLDTGVAVNIDSPEGGLC